MGDCVFCEHHGIVEDNHRTLEWICLCRESEKFFKLLDGNESCECFEEEN